MCATSLTGTTDGCVVDPNWTEPQPSGITNISDMASDMLIGTSFTPDMANDYGCVGRGDAFDAFTPTIGHPVDEIDEAFFVWKHCIKCASDFDPTKITPYSYDLENDSCAASSDKSRRFCECDRVLMTTLVNYDGHSFNQPYPADR